MYNLDIKRQSITIEGKVYNSEFFYGKDANRSSGLIPHDLFLFLKDWFSDSHFLKVKTSGSTGLPKDLLVEKGRMMQSAKMTCSYFGLKKGDTILLCLPLDYIAGKMMVVRSLIAELNLHIVPPSSNPLSNIDMSFTFAALIPMQVYNILESKANISKLEKIGKVIIGGGFIEESVKTKLNALKNDIYLTYGMTETLSHIALQKINGKDATSKYVVLDSIKLSTTKDNSLVINAPLLSPKVLITNDIVELSENRRSFKIIGRKDNVINSGGIKVQIEEVERKLTTIISGNFAICSLPDTQFGEIVVLVLENGSFLKQELSEFILPKYSIPKKIIYIHKLPLTETGKISRNTLKNIILKIK